MWYSDKATATWDKKTNLLADLDIYRREHTRPNGKSSISHTFAIGQVSARHLVNNFESDMYEIKNEAQLYNRTTQIE